MMDKGEEVCMCHDQTLNCEHSTFLLEEVMAFKFHQGEVSYLQDKKKGIEMIRGDMTNKDLGERHGRNGVELEAVDFCSGRRTRPGSPHNGGRVETLCGAIKGTEQACTCSWLHLQLSRYTMPAPVALTK